MYSSDGRYRCTEQRRERDRLNFAKQRAENYEAHREKQRRSERRRRARKRGVSATPYTRQAVYERDAGKCRYCLEAVGPDWHIAHLLSLARGGEDNLDNVAVSCRTCNLADGVGRLPVQLHIPAAA